MRALVVSVVVVSSLFMGCPPPCEGSSCADAGTVAPMPQTASEACVARRNADFDLQVRCGAVTVDYATYRRAGIAADCASAKLNAVEISSVAACVQKLRNVSCLSDDVYCDRVSGSGPAGTSCFGESDCQADLYCDTRSTCPGSCKPRIPLGETIKEYEQECVDGAYAYVNVCRAFVAEGASCAALSGNSRRQRCAKGLICTSSEVCSKGNEYAGLNEPCGGERYCGAGLRCLGATCAKRVTAMGACASPDDCVTGLACVGGRCETHFGKAGDTCETSTNRYCGTDFFCNQTSSSGVGVCAPLRSSGATCETSNQCARGLFCVDLGAAGECRARINAGGGCAESAVCADELYCSNNSCTYKKSEGASCASSDECLASCSSGVCTMPFCTRP